MSSKGWYVQQETDLPGKEAETLGKTSETDETSPCFFIFPS